jgi:hypothetical protein
VLLEEIHIPGTRLIDRGKGGGGVPSITRIQAVGQLFERNPVHEGVLLGTLHHPRVPLVPHSAHHGLRSHALRSHGVEERGGGGRVIRCSRRRVCALTESYAIQNLWLAVVTALNTNSCTVESGLRSW